MNHLSAKELTRALLLVAIGFAIIYFVEVAFPKEKKDEKVSQIGIWKITSTYEVPKEENPSREFQHTD